MAVECLNFGFSTFWDFCSWCMAVECLNLGFSTFWDFCSWFNTSIKQKNGRVGGERWGGGVQTLMTVSTQNKPQNKTKQLAIKPGREGGPDPYDQRLKKNIKKRSLTQRQERIL